MRPLLSADSGSLGSRSGLSCFGRTARHIQSTTWHGRQTASGATGFGWGLSCPRSSAKGIVRSFKTAGLAPPSQ